MPIKIEVDDKPTLSFDEVHMVSQRIKQKQRAHVDDKVLYQLVIIYQLYAVDDNGYIHYSPDGHRVSVTDYVSYATAHAAVNEMTCVNALAATKAAIAFIINDIGSHHVTGVS